MMTIKVQLTQQKMETPSYPSPPLASYYELGTDESYEEIKSYAGTMWVSVQGDDTAAQANDKNKPFRQITTAVNAIPGHPNPSEPWLVLVTAGEYEPLNEMPTNVHIKGIVGRTLIVVSQVRKDDENRIETFNHGVGFQYHPQADPDAQALSMEDIVFIISPDVSLYESRDMLSILGMVGDSPHTVVFTGEVEFRPCIQRNGIDILHGPIIC